MPKFRVEVSLTQYFTVEVEAEDDASARADAEGAVRVSPLQYYSYEGCFEATGCEEIG